MVNHGPENPIYRERDARNVVVEAVVGNVLIEVSFVLRRIRRREQ